MPPQSLSLPAYSPQQAAACLYTALLCGQGRACTAAGAPSGLIHPVHADNILGTLMHVAMQRQEYSEVHKYSKGVTVFVILPLYSTTIEIWNEANPDVTEI